jgi:hypothetical protein
MNAISVMSIMKLRFERELSPVNSKFKHLLHRQIHDRHNTNVNEQ